MADKANDNPLNKGFLSTGEAKSHVGIYKDELSKNFSGMSVGSVIAAGLGLSVAGAAGGMMLGILPAFMTEKYTETARVPDASIVYGLQQDGGHRLLDFNDRDVMLIRAGAEYQLYTVEEPTMDEEDADAALRRVLYISNAADALEFIDTTLATIDRVLGKLANGQSLADEDLPNLQSASGVSIPYSEGNTNITRYFDAVRNDPAVNGDYAAVLTNLRGELGDVRRSVLDGGYGMNDGANQSLPDSYRARITVLLSAMAAGSLFALSLPVMLGPIGATRRRVRKNKGLIKE